MADVECVSVLGLDALSDDVRRKLAFFKLEVEPLEDTLW